MVLELKAEVRMGLVEKPAAWNSRFEDSKHRQAVGVEFEEERKLLLLLVKLSNDGE